MLYIFGGLPATGKTELSRYLAHELCATYLRIDSIEQQLRNSGYRDLYDEAYQIAFAFASDNLKSGKVVVADSTNPVAESRTGWINAAEEAGSAFLEIEIICSDIAEHRQRVEGRETDIPGLRLPDWNSVISREYEQWQSADLVIDTAGKSPEQSKQQLIHLINRDTSRQ